MIRTALAIAFGCVTFISASFPPDVTLEALVGQSQLVAVGRVVEVIPTDQPIGPGSISNFSVARFAVRAYAQAESHAEVLILVSNADTDAWLEPGEEYVVFLVMSEQMPRWLSPDGSRQVLEVAIFDRGQMQVTGNSVRTGGIRGEPNDQPVCELLAKVAAISHSRIARTAGNEAFCT